MVTPTLAVAPSPHLLARIEQLERRVAGLEAAQAVTDDINADGPPRPGRWLRMKAAARATGYSESGLRKLARQGRIICDFSGPHLLINVSSVPSKVLKVPKVRP